MNRLDIKLGGHNLVREDFTFMQAQLANAITSFAKTLKQPLLSIHGCEVSVSGGNFIWTPGFLYINGELCEVVAGSAPLTTNNTWAIVESPDTSGNQTYEDGSSQQPYLYRRAELKGTAGGVNYRENIQYLRDYFVSPPQQTTEIFTPGSGWYIVIPSIYSGGLYVWRSQTNEVMFNGRVQTNTNYSTSNPVCLVLDVKYRPWDVLTVLAPAIVNGVNKAIHLKVSSNGDVSPLGLSNGDVVTIIFDGVRYGYLPLPYTY